MPNIWDQFKIAKKGADAWAGWGLGVLNAPIEAARNIAENYRPGPENEPLNADIGRQGMTAAAVLSPGIARASTGELGVAAGRILQRPDAIKLLREMRAKGSTDREIAAALNERFAPILDEGQEVTKGMVVGRRQRDTELGAFGGRGSNSRIAPEDVTRIADELGLAARVKSSSGGTEYVKIHDPVSDPHRQLAAEVRIPAETAPHRGPSRPWTIDTSDAPMTTGSWRREHPVQSQRDLAGDLYEGNLPAVRSRLEYIFGRQKQPPDVPAPIEGGPIKDPRQLQLLSGGAPVPIMDPWQTETIREDAGKFSRPLVTPDDKLVSDTRELTERVKSAADAPAEIQRFRSARDPRWDDLVPFLREIQSLNPGYVPGERESDNIEDRRNDPPPKRSIWEQFARWSAG